MIVARAHAPAPVILPQARRVKVPCRSIFTRMVCCLPIIGNVVQIVCLQRIKNHLTKKLFTQDSITLRDRVVQHHKVKNSLMKCGLYRDAITLAVVSALTGFKVISFSQALPIFIHHPIVLAASQVNILKSEQIIKRYDNTNNN